MPHNIAHDLTRTRRESTTRRAGPLFSYEPLPPNRERKPPAQASKKRRRPTPPTSAFVYNPQDRLVPNGIHDPSAPPPASSTPATSEILTNGYEQQTTSFCGHEMHTQFVDECAQGWSYTSDHATGHSISSCPDTSYPENDMSPVAPDPHDSPASYTSSSSDQSPRTADFAIPGVDHAPPAQPSMQMCPYPPQGYVAVHQGPYGYSVDPYPDQPMQGYDVQYVEPARGRPGLHGGPPCPGNNGYQYANSRRS